MRKASCICIVILLLASLTVPAFAIEQYSPVTCRVSQIDNNITVIDELFENTQTRSNSKSYTYKRTVKDNGTTIAIITIQGVFRYDGSTVSVTSKSVTQTDTYEGWNYKQSSFTSSGSSITLNAKLTKLLFVNVPITMTLSCDKNGNISYT